jgi:hypothetical protein
MPVLIDRLVLRKLFPYAIKICEYLKVPDAEGKSRILAHWACYKVRGKRFTVCTEIAIILGTFRFTIHGGRLRYKRYDAHFLRKN